jgi:hypothetical protein
MARLNILDLAKMNGSDAVVGLIEESLVAAPEVATIPSRTIKGTSFKTLIRTGLPTVGFRSLNQGMDGSKSTFAEKLVQCFIAGGLIEVDKAAAAGYDGGESEVQAIEAAGIMEAALRDIGSQVFYGVSNDAKGFPGLQAMYDSEIEVDGTATTAKSSVYAVRFGTQGVQLIFGEQTPFTLSPWVDGYAEDANGKKFPAWLANLNSWVGLQCVNKYAVGRIKALGANNDTGKTLTDAKVAELLSKWRGPSPDVLFMNRRSLYQLQTSRTVTINAGPAQKVAANIGSVAPVPTESNGIPIVMTDQITSAEA